MPRIIPSLWFDTQGEQAAEFYTSLFPNSEITGTTRYPAGTPGPEGEVMTVDLTLDGQPFNIINGGPQFTFDEAVSFVIEVDDQAELDRYWDALTADGGSEIQCGWCKDRFGLSWQVVPKGMQALFDDPDEGRAQRSMQAMLGMKKLDIAAMQAAADAEPAA